MYGSCGFKVSNFELRQEGAEYFAAQFYLNDFKIEHRKSKITPTKVGQFVTLWKRNDAGITVPLDFNDYFDFVCITSEFQNMLGQFIFSKKILCEQKIITCNSIDGKRGFRVYPPWHLALNKQATQTQHWQADCFVLLKGQEQIDIFSIKQKIQAILASA